jgi:hypothetical protein
MTLLVNLRSKAFPGKSNPCDCSPDGYGEDHPAVIHEANAILVVDVR